MKTYQIKLYIFISTDKTAEEAVPQLEELLIREYGSRLPCMVVHDVQEVDLTAATPVDHE